MLALGEACTKAGGLTSLRSFTLTTRPQNSTKSWMNGTELLLSGSSLEVLQIYVPDLAVALSDQFFIGVIEQHRDHLVRFSFHRSCISLDVIEQLCLGCPMLEELFVVIHHNRMVHFPFSSSSHTFIWELSRHTFSRCLPRPPICTQCTSKSSTDHQDLTPLTSSTRWTSFTTAVGRFPRLESQQKFGK